MLDAVNLQYYLGDIRTTIYNTGGGLVRYRILFATISDVQ